MSTSSAQNEITANLDFPPWADFLFQPTRYKVIHGGRGSGKSWAVARALLILATRYPLRILCTREVQKSIKDSVKRLLDDQIEAMGLGPVWESTDTEIRGRNGSLFLFTGLATHNADSIKSYEAIDICWIEEAQTISKTSLDILTPTIRKDCIPGLEGFAEIWITFNPMLDTDEVWRRFVENPPPNCYVRAVNYDENPWFPQVLEEERAHCEATQAKEDYENIWKGICRPTVKGAIYATEISEAILEDRVRPVPYDPRLKVHAIWDLGWNDAMSIILVQVGIAELRVIGYIEDSFKTLDYYAAKLKAMNINWGYDWLPHDGKTKDFKTGKSPHEILKSFGRKTRETPNIGVENGIKAARMTLPRTYFDKAKTARLIECLKRYRRSVNEKTGEPGAPVHDEYSHGADAFRYLGVVAAQLTNEADDAPIHSGFGGYDVLDEVIGW